MKTVATLFSTLLFPLIISAGCDAEDADFAAEAEVEADADVHGKADVIGWSCVVNDDCLEDEYCSFPFVPGSAQTCGQDDTRGTCKPLPLDCPSSTFPFHDGVCGCDGQSYINPVCAAVEGVSIRNYGLCTF